MIRESEEVKNSRPTEDDVFLIPIHSEQDYNFDNKDNETNHMIYIPMPQGSEAPDRFVNIPNLQIIQRDGALVSNSLPMAGSAAFCGPEFQSETYSNQGYLSSVVDTENQPGSSSNSSNSESSDWYDSQNSGQPSRKRKHNGSQAQVTGGNWKQGKNGTSQIKKNSSAKEEEKKKEQNRKYAHTSRLKKANELKMLKEEKVQQESIIEIYKKVLNIYHMRLNGNNITWTKHLKEWFPSQATRNSPPILVECLLPDNDDNLLSELGNSAYGTLFTSAPTNVKPCTTDVAEVNSCSINTNGGNERFSLAGKPHVESSNSILVPGPSTCSNISLPIPHTSTDQKVTELPSSAKLSLSTTQMGAMPVKVEDLSQVSGEKLHNLTHAPALQEDLVNILSGVQQTSSGQQVNIIYVIPKQKQPAKTLEISPAACINISSASSADTTSRLVAQVGLDTDKRTLVAGKHQGLSLKQEQAWNVSTSLNSASTPAGSHGQTSARNTPGSHGQTSASTAPGLYSQTLASTTPGLYSQTSASMTPGSYSQTSASRTPGSYSQTSASMTPCSYSQTSASTTPCSYSQTCISGHEAIERQSILVDHQREKSWYIVPDAKLRAETEERSNILNKVDSRPTNLPKTESTAEKSTGNQYVSNFPYLNMTLNLSASTKGKCVTGTGDSLNNAIVVESSPVNGTERDVQLTPLKTQFTSDAVPVPLREDTTETGGHNTVFHPGKQITPQILSTLPSTQLPGSKKANVPFVVMKSVVKEPRQPSALPLSCSREPGVPLDDCGTSQSCLVEISSLPVPTPIQLQPHNGLIMSTGQQEIPLKPGAVEGAELKTPISPDDSQIYMHVHSTSGLGSLSAFIIDNDSVELENLRPTFPNQT